LVSGWEYLRSPAFRICDFLQGIWLIGNGFYEQPIKNAKETAGIWMGIWKIFHSLDFFME